MKRRSSSSPPTSEQYSSPPKPNDAENNNQNQQCRTPKRKMISLKSLMASLHCSPIKPINTNNHISELPSSSNNDSVNTCTNITHNSNTSNNENNQLLTSSRNQEVHLTPPSFPVSEELDRKLMPSPRKRITLRIKSSPKSSRASSSSGTPPKHNDIYNKTPNTVHSTRIVADSCSSSDYHRSSTTVDSPYSASPIVENIPMDQVVGFFFLYESQESLKQATYSQVVPLRKGKSLVSRKSINDVIRNKKLPLFDHWICIDRTYISRVHALVEVSNGEFVFVEDLSSSNSTHIVEKTEKRKINVNIESNRLYQLRDCNYILFGKLLCQYREKSEMDEQAVSEAMQLYYSTCNATKTPQKLRKNTLAATSIDGSKQKITIPETPEFNRPSKLPSRRDRIVPPTVYADRTHSSTPVLALETPKRIQECLKTQPTDNPILSIEQTPPSISKPSSSTSSGFVTPSNIVLLETPGNGSSNDKKDSPKASDQSDQVNLTDIDLSCLSLPDDIFEDDEEEEEKQQESTLEDDIMEDEIVLTEDEEENERKRSFEDDEDSFIAPKKKLKTKKSEHQSPHILFTGISPTEENIKAIERLGGVLVEEAEAELLASRLTHLITDKIRRTVKFLCALGSCPNIVTVEWLERSARSRYFIDEDGYYLQDLEGEQKFNMTLIEVMNKRDRLSHKLFHKMSFFLTGGIQPRVEEMKLIIECNGGKTIPTLNGLRCELGIHNRVFVITAENDRTYCTKNLVPIFSDFGIENLENHFFTNEFVLTSVINQNIIKNSITKFNIHPTQNNVTNFSKLLIKRK